VVPTTPVQVRYTLTERGRELLIGLMPLVRWGQKWDPVLADNDGADKP
jgi:DNA-binding HxlR family transcriptional regulator